MNFVKSKTKEHFFDVDAKWVLEENRFFTKCPDFSTCLEGKNMCAKNTWLELTRYIIEDLQWLLELENHKFWSFMIYSKEAHQLVFSVLRECAPCYLRHSSLLCEEIVNNLQKLEKLIFLIFLRMSTAYEPEDQKLDDLGEVLYNNYLFTVPVILDICLIYGTNNPELVNKIIRKVIDLNPNFLKDFQEMVPHFFRSLQLVKDSILTMEKTSEELKNSNYIKMKSLLFFLLDSVATVEIFLNLYPKACHIFCGKESVQEIVSFYSNVLPEMQAIYKKNEEQIKLFEFYDLFEKIRLDMLKIVKSLLNFKVKKCKSVKDNKDEAVDEYLNMVQELLSEPNFLSDYNALYPLEADIEAITLGNENVDFIKVNHILQGISLCKNSVEGNADAAAKHSKNESEYMASVDLVKFNSMITEVKDIFPHLEEGYIKTLLECDNWNVEKVISSILDGSSTNKKQSFKNPSVMNQSNSKNFKSHKSNENLNSFFNLRENVDHKISLRDYNIPYDDLMNENYEDEYDDSYDGNLDLPVEEPSETEPEIRPFVVPRVLRNTRERRNFFNENDETKEEDDDDDEEEKKNVLEFLKNPEELRENQRRRYHGRPNFNREKNEGQRKNVQQARNFKETHKSFIGNHNRKNQANRKRNF